MPEEMKVHEKFMRRAVALARRGLGRTSPNPVVGCVLVKDGLVIGEGWHRKAGTPHAEVHALRQAGSAARGADVYVTLEPCSHYGKTPPCANALIEAGVARVFIGMVDPNPKVCTRGISLLKEAGIQVFDDLLTEQCQSLNEPFIKHITTGLPFVILKSALTLDGKTATRKGDSKWISSEKSRAYVHKLRSLVDGVMVGVGTVVADDPLLTARIPGGRDPVRIIVDSTLRTPANARVINRESPAGTIIAACSTDPDRAARLEQVGAQVLRCRETGGRVDLAELLTKLGQAGMQSILVEGGSELAGDLLRCGLVDKMILFYAPLILGGEGKSLFAGQGVALMSEATMLRNMSFRKIGPDLMVEGYPER